MNKREPRQGPLAGIRVVELGGIGPGPFAGMLLADMGADVIRLDRPSGGAGGTIPPEVNFLHRGRRSLALDLRRPAALAAVLRLVERSDAVIEGFRPGVVERLGLGPDVCLARNPRLVFGRVTGWGREGPLAGAAGHDINYVALTGVLDAIGRAGERPVPPLNLVGDFGGGGMLLGFGIVCALLEARGSGRGQVVDAAMIDGVSLQATLIHGLIAAGLWQPERGVNLLDSGAPFYDVYATGDGRHVAVGAIEPQFYADLLGKLGLAGEDLPHQMDRSAWPAMKERFAAIFRTRTLAEWNGLLEGGDACYAPVLTFAEAPGHAHNRARHGYIDVGGAIQPAPAPRFSLTPGAVPSPPPATGADNAEILAELGLSEAELADLG
ncbi:MAG: CaiB/BaiF CoA-transferase family protein [Candidatus Dormibacteraceae bacterium]